ncbi:hypothetical protein K469DRAFT_717195 [Zopfia rhizophila CBS 207.26]|uniref:Uncharacterized protein n=1 Tax=Zopfia rhizophila CBS 207.26 TaxID=1314779 RepID=A0A6A6EN77_9PEZI|nr:hypothetical protein K469DRAFT_717195 [Zopfia rhizophila CBS 207.26]
MSEHRASSGVRNLRAMFENQGAPSSPEPRGRSPAGIAANTDNNRPTSKVRASFVSVEPSSLIAKDLGTTKGTTDGINSANANRRESFSVTQEHGENVVAELKKTVSQEKEERKISDAVVETIPEQAVDARESSRPPPPIRDETTKGTMPNLGSIMKGSDFPEPEIVDEQKPKVEETAVKAAAKPEPTPKKVGEKPVASSSTDAPGNNPDKIVTGVQEDASLKLADLKDEATVSGGEALPPPTEVLPPAATEQHAPEAPRKEAPKATTSTLSKVKVSGATSNAATSEKTATKKPPAISTSKAPTTKATSSKSPLPRSPGLARAPKTPTTPKTASSASATKSPAHAKEQPKAPPPAPKASRASLRPSTTSTTASAAAKTKASVLESKKPATKPAASASKDTTQTSPGGFKKPKPKSPTRPVRLPSHLTAPTASSAAKHDEDAAQKPVRKPSTISRHAPPKTTPPARKQPSRASLAPQPAKRPESRASTKGAADEGFLARMMRPTASSASKTHEKPTSPPRRGAPAKVPTKPRPGHESAVAKGKRKAGEVASKAKEAVTTNGHDEGEHAEDSGSAEAIASSRAAPELPDELAQSERESTPAEQEVESSAVELQTPNFEGQAIR